MATTPGGQSFVIGREGHGVCAQHTTIKRMGLAQGRSHGIPLPEFDKPRAARFGKAFPVRGERLTPNEEPLRIQTMLATSGCIQNQISTSSLTKQQPMFIACGGKSMNYTFSGPRPGFAPYRHVPF